MEQDRKLTDWAQRFLRDYRINPDDPDSEFYPTYLPPPPRAPILRARMRSPSRPSPLLFPQQRIVPLPSRMPP